MLGNLGQNIQFLFTFRWKELLLQANAADILALCALVIVILIVIVVVVALVRGESPMTLLSELEKIFVASLGIKPNSN
jgi:hypothetical protein